MEIVGNWLKANYPSVKPNEIVGLQFMRYLAALAVLVDHLIVAICDSGALSKSWLPFAYKLGDVGVFLFFAISGFVMVLSNRDKFQVRYNSIDFFVRRLIRIWPMYFVATIVVFGMKYGTDPSVTFENLLKSLSFIPYVDANDLYRPILGKGWTLNYEMFFYVIFAACLALPKRAGLLAAGFVLLMLGICEGTGSGTLWRFYANGIVLYFLVGIALAYIVRETQVKWAHSRRAEIAMISGVLLFVLLLYLNIVVQPSIALQGLMLLLTFGSLYCVCFSDSTFASPRFTSLISLLGDSSYCLYLFHGFFFFALKPILKHSGAAALMISLPLIVILVTAACILIHLCLEKPVNRIMLNAYKNIKLARQPVALPGSRT